MRNLMKQTANMRKMQPHSGQKSTKMKTHQRPQIFYAPVFQMSTKHMEPVTTIRNQYLFLQEVEKKDTNSPSRKQKKNARINQVIFHQIAISRFFLINSRTITFARTNHS